MSDELYIYVIYAGMPEYPGKFILRRDVVANGGRSIGRSGVFGG